MSVMWTHLGKRETHHTAVAGYRSTSYYVPACGASANTVSMQEIVGCVLNELYLTLTSGWVSVAIYLVPNVKYL